MLSYMKRLDRAFSSAPRLPITNDTKYVFFSDCHRGNGTNNDNFLKNENAYLAALEHYYQSNFCYIEVGDGDELWENRTLSQITEIHEKVFSFLSCFQKEQRLYLLYGNHDMVKKDSPGIQEGLILHSQSPSVQLRVTHGHQADFFNSVLWKLTRFLVRYFWSPLETFGVLDPTSAAKNNTKRDKIEKKLLHYAKENDCFILCGHTHRPTLHSTTSPYFNCGSCIHPNGITCIELEGLSARLVRWHTCVKPSTCCDTYPLYICREVLKEETLLETSPND